MKNFEQTLVSNVCFDMILYFDRVEDEWNLNAGGY